MGRLFARLFLDRVSQLVLFDLFGVGPRQSNASLVLQELRIAASSRGISLRVDEIRSNQADFADADCVVSLVRPEEAPSALPCADVVLLALRFESAVAYRQVIAAYQPWISPGSLVVDLGSIKALPMTILSETFGRDVGLLGAHPLFGPTVSNLAGLIVAAVDPSDGRPASKWRDWFLEQLADLCMIVTPTSADEHDDAMAFVQSLTHFALLAFAYTFVKLDRDPADLLALRTPVFEPLLYLAARVANLARSSPDTYRSIQTFSARADARRTFVDAANEILGAIESAAEASTNGGASHAPDRLIELFRHYGEPWSPERKDRGDRSRREHFLDMGASLVDHLNQLRQEIVTSVGAVRAVEERRTGQPPRVVVGVVDLDLLDPGKLDVATRVRLRRLNLGLGSVHGGIAAAGDGAGGRGQDELIPLARARLLDDDELFAWLFQTNQLVERRMIGLIVPRWFDREVLRRLVVGRRAPVDDMPIWDVDVREAAVGAPATNGTFEALITLSMVVHPATVFALRQQAQQAGDADFRVRLADFNARLNAARHGEGEAVRLKDQLKHARKALVDRRTAEVDREIRRLVRTRVNDRCDEAVAWLLQHGCQALRRDAARRSGQGPE
jgi:prephenate dehydrogenase